MLTVGSLFSGIGGIDLGLERAGMKVLWQVEIDPWCRAVLAKHWPDVERHADVRDASHVPPGAFGGRRYMLPRVDLIAGGFPCQDISGAGSGQGISGSRSGLWGQFARIVSELRPRYVLVENVALLKSRGLEVVLADLASSGYDAEWDCLPAAAVGAPHLRDRLWIVAYREKDASRPDADDAGPHRAHANAAGQEREVQPRDEQGGLPGPLGAPVADAGESFGRRTSWAGWRRESAADLAAEHHRNRSTPDGQWCAEPPVGRVADGLPGRVDRLTGLGNAVVPQVVEWIGRRIVEAEAQSGVS